jgi:ATP-binding cassette, subfamily B, bacterial
MAGAAAGVNISNPISRILKVLRLERNEIWSVYFYAILAGLIQLSLPLGIQSIISFVLGGTISTSLIVLTILVVVGVFLGGMLQVNQMRLIEKVQQKLFVRYGFEFAERIPRLQLQNVDGYYLPELVNRFFDTVSLQKGISKLLLEIPTATIQILFGLILLSFYHPVFIFFGIILVLSVYIVLRVTASKGLETSMRESDYKYGVGGWLEELARVIKSFKFARNTELNIKRTDQLMTGYLESRTSHFRILLSQYWTLIVFKVLITAAMLIVGSYLLVEQQLNIGQFIAAEIVILMVINSVEKLITNLDNVYDVLTSVEKLSKITDQKMDKEGHHVLEHSDDGLSVVMNEVSFSYDDSHTENQLKGVQMTVNPGEKVCVLGPSGSGKSTLLRLLSGAYPNFSGSILINAIPIANYSLSSLRDQTGVLLSRQDIFNGTVLENITMGCETYSLPTILELAEKIGLKTFLSELPNGFDTKVDPTGKRLSSKIIQKIVLLRALINQPRLMLLEEPFVGLDPDNKKQVMEYLVKQTGKQTVICASNDYSFAELCDKVVYMDHGRIVATGSWNSIKNSIV